MKYLELNALHKRFMKSQCSSDMHFDWQEHDVLDVFLGKLPDLRYTTKEYQSTLAIRELEKIYRSYNAFKTDVDDFLNTLQEKVSTIQKTLPNWYGISLHLVEQYVKMHRFCLISGEGGIGKSYFVMELEEALANYDIPHLCIYGKILKDIERIDFDEIISEEQFIFVIDALNEMSLTGQKNLLEQIKRLKANKGCRIIITYRNSKVPQQLLDQYKALASFEYEFQGVSFESALDCLVRQEIPNVHMYEDILYSNNPLYLTILSKTLSKDKMANKEVNHKLNNLTSITNILEQYVKDSLNKAYWENTKRVAEWMYKHNSKRISLTILEALVENGRLFFEEMQQRGFMSSYQSEGVDYCFFSMETLSDFLIARTIMNELPKDDIEGQISLLKEKLDAFFSFEEAFILILFDLFSPNYKHIQYLMERTGMMDAFRHETLLKVIFRSERISSFQEVFKLHDPLDSFEIFAGYTNQPFNCTNYMNCFLQNKEMQLCLSNILEGKHSHTNILNRLKNILYALNTTPATSLQVEEAYWFALWCCSSPNEKIRKLAMKLLFDIINSHSEYRYKTISAFPQFYDHYIQEAIIFVLSTCPYDEKIRRFFQNLIHDSDFLLGRSIRRIATYMNTPYGYITWNKHNVRDNTYEVPQDIEKLTLYIDSDDKDFLPFRWWGRSHIEMHRTFLDINKDEITEWNKLLNHRFKCLTVNSDCCGSLAFAEKAETLFGRDYSSKRLNADIYYRTMAKIANNLLHVYPVNLKEPRYIYGDFAASLIKKCFDIANDIVLGSFMCNYYSSEFSTYNSDQNCLGYEVYDPLAYKEYFSIATPLPNYGGEIEEMDSIVEARVSFPATKDTVWVKDIELTRKNLAALQNPLSFKNQEWIMIAGRINWNKNDSSHLPLWKDSYLLYCCTASDITLLGEGNERYLTIELDDYKGSLSEYCRTSYKPYLCKSMPSLSTHDFDLLDDTGLVLPPAELIRNLNLTINMKNMTWVNDAKEIILFCNNVKYSYFTSTVGCTIFMRKDVYDEYIKNYTLKFFAFAERYHPETGYADETSMHFEIENGKIQKEFNNYGQSKTLQKKSPLNDCLNCPYKFYESSLEQENKMKEILLSIKDDIDDTYFV